MAIERTTEEDAQQQPIDAEAIAKAVQQACSQEAEGNLEEEVDLEAELAVEKDLALRLRAEMENLRARTTREIGEERRYGPLPLARDLLPVVDNIDRAIEATDQNSDAQSLLEGFLMVRQQLLAVLQRHHCQAIDALGEPFDPQIHEAISQMPSDEFIQNSVMLVTAAGYQMHDRVVRPSQVIVSSGPAAAADAAESSEE